jgi:hypothetical protein
MNKIVVGIFLFFCSIHLAAQITITSADYPSLNDTIIYGVDNNASIDISGKGLQTWDFSMLENEGIDTLVFFDPSTTAFTSSFTNSNLATEVGEQINYYSKDASMFANDGYVGKPISVGPELALPYGNLQALMVFPATYTSLMSDTSDAEIRINAKPFTSNMVDSTWIKHTTYSYSEVDGYGSLTLPNGQVHNTLKQSSTAINIDSVWIYVSNAITAGFLGVAPNQWVFSPPISGVITDNPVIDTLYTHNWIAEGKNYPLVETTVDTLEGTPLVTNFRIGGVVGATLAPTNISCNGMDDGALEVTPTVGFSPYTYVWNTGATTTIITGLNAGNYAVTVTDMFSDTVSATIELTEPAIVTANLSITDVRCYGESNGTVEILNVAGNTPYSFLWSNGATTDGLTGWSGDTLSLSITANGCEGILDSIVIIEPDTIGTIFLHDGSGNTTITVSGGISSYSYLWNDGATTNVPGVNYGCLLRESEFLYEITITDFNGCVKTDSSMMFCDWSSIKELSNNLSIYPNPTSGSIYVDLLDNSQINSVTIFDALGKQVLSATIENHSQIDLSNFQKGLYYIRIDTDKGIITRKITLTK